MKQLRIVIAEDSKGLRNLLERRLSAIEGLNVVGAVANGIEAIQAVKELKPHILILDISMPFKNGIEVLKELRQEDSSTVVIMFTDDPDLFTRRACLEAGANYFLDKSQVTELMEICKIELLAG